MLSIFRDDLKRWACNVKTEISKREQDQRTQTIFLGGIADSTADRPRAGSSVFILVSLQIIYIFLYFFAAHMLIKLAFPCCFWLKDGEVCCGWSNQCIVTHIHMNHILSSFKSLPQNCYSYQNYIFAAFDFSWINAVEEKTLIRNVCTSNESSLWFRGQWKLCLSYTFLPVSVE